MALEELLEQQMAKRFKVILAPYRDAISTPQFLLRSHITITSGIEQRAFCILV